MSRATQTRPAPADRLPRLQMTMNRGQEIRLGAFGVLGILLLVIGVPIALALFVGYPLPRSAPSRDWLTESITATLLIKILACVVWALWAHFTVCIIAEWRALRRGRLPADIPLGGGSQALARRLVAAALLLAGTATTVGNLAATTHSTGPQARRNVVSTVHGKVTGTPAVAKSAAADAQAGAQHAARGAKTYVVEPPQGRHHDCLWDIAERTLGDPMRYKEIFALNKDRVQADGSKLVDANLIRPGWQLHLPADASGPGVHVAPGRATPVPTGVPAPTAAAGSAAGAAVQGATTGAARVPALGAGSLAGLTGAARVAAGAPQDAGTSWQSDLLGGGLLLAGIALALSARRGPYGAASDDEHALRQAADTALAQSLNRALRNLAAARREQGRELPQLVLAWASHDDVTLSFAGGDLTDPPAPWREGGDGRSWSCRLGDVADHADLDSTAAPYPALLSVGRDGPQELFVDFELAPGVVSVGGDVERVRDLLLGLVVHAVTSVCSDGARATLVGFGDGAGLCELDPHSIKAVSQLSAVLDELEREDATLHRLQRALGVDGVLSGRLAHRSRTWQPHVVVLSGLPTTEELQRVQSLTGSGRSQLVVLVVGDLLPAAWRFAIDSEGQLDLGVLGARANAHRLDRDGMARLIELVRDAQANGRAAGAAVVQMTPHRALADVGDRPDPGGAAAFAVDQPMAPAAVNVSLLGPVGVTAPGPVPDGRRELLTEIVVAVALHPNGLHDAVLRASIWPRGASDEVVAATMAEVAGWLGVAPDGQPCLRVMDGRWFCSGAYVDWIALQRLAESAIGDSELDTLLRGVGLFRGAAFTGTPAGRYGWLAFARAARDARMLATVVTRRAAALLLQRHRDVEAEDVLRRGLRLVPTAEPLWRDLLEVLGRRGPDPAAAGVREMYATLQRHRIWPEPETDALVAALAPGFDPEGPVPAAPAIAG